jgi:hypothetical protein
LLIELAPYDGVHPLNAIRHVNLNEKITIG